MGTDDTDWREELTRRESALGSDLLIIWNHLDIWTNRLDGAARRAGHLLQLRHKCSIRAQGPFVAF